MRAFGLRRSRYIGLDKTHLQHVGRAAAIHLARVVAWLDGDEACPHTHFGFPEALRCGLGGFPNSVRPGHEPFCEREF